MSTEAEGLRNITRTELTNALGIGYNKWIAVVENVDIDQTDLVGIAITATGTCIAISSLDTEMDLSNYPVGAHKMFPKKFKTGLIATVFALYMV